MKRTNNTRHTETGYRDNVIDLASRRRGLLERRGADPLEIAVHLCATTGDLPSWDLRGHESDDDGGWAA